MYTNFSMPDIGMIFGVGSILWVFHGAVDTIVKKVQQLTGRGRIGKLT
jgi:hypothetical protein